MNFLPWSVAHINKIHISCSFYATKSESMKETKPRSSASSLLIHYRLSRPGNWSTGRCFYLVHPMSWSRIVFLMTLYASKLNNVWCSNFRAVLASQWLNLDSFDSQIPQLLGHVVIQTPTMRVNLLAVRVVLPTISSHGVGHGAIYRSLEKVKLF